MTATGIEALGWIVAGSLIAVIAAIVFLIRSGRTVPPPSLRWRSRLLHRAPPAARDLLPGAGNRHPGARATRTSPSA